MLSKEDFAVIQALARRGVYQKDIAEELGVTPKTVSRALKRGSAPMRERAKRGSKLAAYQDTVDRLLADGVWNAMVVLREIQALGYSGGVTVLRQYIAPKRALRPGRGTVRFESEPGRQLQSDWGETVTCIAGEPTKVHFSVNVLGYSRRLHFWCADSQDAEHTYEGLVRSFEYFGGVPAEVLVDNQKAAVLVHQPGQAIHFNERFADLATHYGFEPRACRPYRARTKAKVEVGVQVVERWVLAPLRDMTFFGLAAFNQAVTERLADINARPMPHLGASRCELFELLDRPALFPLPESRFEVARWRRVLVPIDYHV